MNNKKIALVGRPNVGKSTLFNRLAKFSKAIVHEMAGVTRDRKYADGKISDLEFVIIDTPGLEETKEGKLEYDMMQQTITAIKESDLICLVVDGKSPLNPVDQFFVNFIRRYGQNYCLVINKCESKHMANEYHKLGIENFAIISAAHGLGMMELYHLFNNMLNVNSNNILEEDHENFESNILDQTTEHKINIVIAGRPNVGKSTFINSIVGYERMLTGDIAGLTRESVSITWEYKNYQMCLIDTAGLRKKSSVDGELELLSSKDTINSINFANVVVLMIDALRPMEQQDIKIASYIIEQGRALVIVINKYDLVVDQEGFKEEMQYLISKYFSNMKGISITYISAINKQHIDLVLDSCMKAYKQWNYKISTGKLNRWLSDAMKKHQLPLLANGRRVRIKYITQIKTRPPTFKLFVNNTDEMNESYLKYLQNDLRKSFDLTNTSVRFVFTKAKNPYAKNN